MGGVRKLEVCQGGNRVHSGPRRAAWPFLGICFVGEGKEPRGDEQLLQAPAALASLPTWPLAAPAGQSSRTPFKLLDASSATLGFLPASTSPGLPAPAPVSGTMAGQKTVSHRLAAESIRLSFLSLTDLRSFCRRERGTISCSLHVSAPKVGQRAGGTQELFLSNTQSGQDAAIGTRTHGHQGGHRPRNNDA